MNAIRVHEFGAPQVLRYEPVAAMTPGVGQVLVRVHAAGVNPVETYIRSGQYASKPALPYTPGTDGAGVIEAVGPGVDAGVVPGQRVYLCRSVTGTYATHCLADAAIHVRPLPDGISFEQGAALFVPYYTAYQAAFHRGEVRPGDTVLVHGATGGVGLAAVQWLAAAGVRILATGGSAQGLDLLRQHGAHAVFNHHDPGYTDLIRHAAPHGVDVILEMLANKNLSTDLTLLAPGGRVVIIGSRGEVTINPRHTMGIDADIRGMTLFNTTPRQLARIHAAVDLGLRSGKLSPVIARRIPLRDAANAHEMIVNPDTRATGKVVLLA